MVGLSDAAGIQLLVHPQNVMPFPEESGVLISAGQLTHVAIQKVRQ